jgi:prepilin-type N-terminal cleavage/methylation domain-containing protein
MRTRRGFTLIELLVVIAIIAILAAILFPVFLSAKQKARTVKCLAHGRQVGEATMMYMADNNDRFPSNVGSWPGTEGDLTTPRGYIINYLNSITWQYTWDTTKGPQTWSAHSQAQWRYVQLFKYCKNEDMWICPDPNTMYAKRYAYGFRCSWLPRTSDKFVDGDRGFQTDEDCGDPVSGMGRTMAEVQALDASSSTDTKSRRYMPPTKKIMWMCYAIGRWGNTSIGNPPGVYPWIFPSYAHQDGSVFVYADGHASWQKMGMGWAPIGYTSQTIDSRQ